MSFVWRFRWRHVAGLLAASLVLFLAAACGGSDSDSDADSTTTAQTTTAVPDTTTGPSERTQELAELLPDTTPIGDLSRGSLTELPDAQALVDELYREGDPSRDQAIERFRAGGYDLGVLRDQVSAAADDGPRLVRTYVIGFATPGAAQTEVSESVEEVKRASTAASTDVPVEGVPGAEAVSLEAEFGPGETGMALFVTFTSGRFLYGIQAFAQGEDESLRQGAVLDVARATYEDGTR